MSAPVADELPSHGYAIARPVRGSSIPMDLTFVLTHDEIYVPVIVRKPAGDGPFPVITMGRGDGKGGVPHLEAQIEGLAPMQDEMIRRGYVVAYVNYRNEVPHLYERQARAENVADDISGGVRRTVKSGATLDSDDFIAILRYLRTLPYVNPRAIGASGVSHSGEIILKAAAETDFAAGVVIEGASHEFLSVDTGPAAPRHDNELQYQDIEVVRRNADKARAMARIGRIRTPMLHFGREGDHLQGIFQLAHEWMQEAGRESSWACFQHPWHGYPYIYRKPDGAWQPDPVQQQAFELMMAFFDRHLKAQ